MTLPAAQTEIPLATVLRIIGELYLETRLLKEQAATQTPSEPDAEPKPESLGG